MKRITFVVWLFTLHAVAAEAQLRAIQEKTHTCGIASISCGQTVTGNLSLAHDCSLGGGQVVDFYEFVGGAGTTVTIDAMSSSFDTFLALLSPDTNNDNDDVADDDSGEGTNSRIVHTLTSSGEWAIGVANFVSFQEGPYTLRLLCSGTGTGCVPSATALCLANGRFRVEATFQTGTGQTGAAQVVQLTPDTGYLWFFSASNVEAVVKILNACGFNQRFWVFAGGLTDVRVVLTVTDTQTGQQKTYTNPLGAKFQPIQDTSAFATCP